MYSLKPSKSLLKTASTTWSHVELGGPLKVGVSLYLVLLLNWFYTLPN